MKCFLPRIPDRADILRRLRDLPALPEAERMRTKPPTRPKPTTIDEWKRRYSA